MELISEFEAELAALHRRHLGRPDEELDALLLIAIERERMVSVAYREALLADRIGTLPLPADVRALIRHALLWIWKDEEMHAVFARGALMRRAGLWLRLMTRAHEVAGTIAGWSTSVLQHVPFRAAPIATMTAGAVTVMGRLGGKVSAAVRPHLQYGTFRAFCRFNIDAEQTAGRGWQRAQELAPELPELDPSWVEAFARMEADESRHRAVFQGINDALDKDDTLATQTSSTTLTEELTQIGAYFLPRSLRPPTERANPIGSGADVHVTTGDHATHALDRALDALDLAGLVAGAGTVAIKTAFMLGTTRRDPSPVIDPVVLSHLTARLTALGVSRVLVLETPNLYDRFFGGRSVAQVAAWFGLDDPGYTIVDAAADQVPHDYPRGLAQHSISASWRDADVRISLSPLRSHPTEHVYLTLGTLESLGTPGDYLFRRRLANREAALMMTMNDCPPDLALIDGFTRGADGIVGVLGCRRPKAPRRIYAGRDALSVDLVAARHLGMEDVSRSPLLHAAVHWFGLEQRPAVLGDDTPIAGWRGPWHSDVSTLLSLVALPVFEHASGEGTLFVPEMDAEAFPAHAPPSWPLRAARAAVRRMLGLHLG